MNKNREHTFRFKQFSLSNTLSAMKVGTDGVLLGAWAQMTDNAMSGKVLDVGCGTGVIALMIAQRYPDVAVTCIDISADAVGECAGNIARSPFCGRVEAVCSDFRQFESNGRYDLIVSNPPFFTETLHSPDAQRAAARHGDSLPLSSLMRGSVALLSAVGRLALVLPAGRDDEALFEASLAGLYPSRRCNVFTREGKPSRRTLWEFSLKPDARCHDSQLFIQDKNGNFTDGYISLVKDFYLDF